MSSSGFFTPHQEKLSRISEKLSNIQNTYENRPARIEAIENKLKRVEDRMSDILLEYNKKINALKDDLSKVQKYVEEDSKAFDVSIENLSQDLGNLDAKFSSRIEQEIMQRKEGEVRVARALEERFNLIKTDILKETKVRAEIIDSLNMTLENDLPKLYELIKSETSEREESDESMLKKIGDEISKLGDQLNFEKKSREESESAIYEMLRDLINRVKNEIETERKERESSEETLLNLIEDACNKLSGLHV